MRFPRFLSELKRRGVHRALAAYVVASFAVLEAADLTLPALGAPPWVYRSLVIGALAGCPVVALLSWIFDVTPKGVRREDEPGAQEGPEVRVAGLSAGSFWTVTALVGVVGAAAWLAGRRTASTSVVDLGSAMAVVPFTPALPDSTLEELGRELAVTLSASLSGTADVETVEPLAVLANVRPDAGLLTTERAAEVAEKLGAGSLVHGTLVEAGDDVRLEVSLYETETRRRLGSERVTARRLDALSDSATLAVVRMLWSERASPAPNPGALSTGSLEALRAYLAGEEHVAAGRWRAAPEAFARAVAADSTFWFAYWRLQYALEYHDAPVDSVIRARVWEHRNELPERDRLLVEARSRATVERVDLLRDATIRFPSYWPAWWDLAEVLVHHGGYMGHTLSESRIALERTLELNPGFVSAWSHLFWVATKRRDAAEMARIVEELSDARFGATSLREGGINSLTFYRALHALVEAGDHVPDPVIETGVEELSGFRGPGDPERTASSLLTFGFLDAQIRLSRELLSRGAAPERMRRAQHYILAHALAADGRWGEAVAAADRFAGTASRAEDLLLPYRVAGVGAWLGAVDPALAAARRPDPAREGPIRGHGDREIRWLDGLVAYAARDSTSLAEARRALNASGEPDARTLARSLEAFRTALSGDRAGAGRALRALERRLVAEGRHLSVGGRHPFVTGVHRVAAAGWLVESGDSVSARALLPWYEAVLPGPLYRLSLANRVLARPARALRREVDPEVPAEVALHAGPVP